VITRVTGAAVDAGLKAGDVVLAIDGEPTEQTFAREGALISSATPQWRRYLLPIYLRVGSAGSEVRLKVQSQGAAQREVLLHRGVKVDDAPSEPRPATVAELEPGIFYFDIGRAVEADLESALPKLADAKAVIFDLRGYPKMLEYLVFLKDQHLQSPIWQIPIVTKPDRLGTEYETSGRWDLPPMEPRLKGRIIFMTDGRAVSFAESVMGIVEAYRLGDIVGETTAGTNGDINPFVVPGGYTLWWTGLRVLRHDGTRHHGVGIRPTHPVSRSIKGISEGRDEVLDKALELARTPR
jgi:C-terminal processing protease CtpA/Prc